MTETMVPPDAARAEAFRGASWVRENPSAGVSLAGIEVAEALLGHRVFEERHALAMARHSYDPVSVSGLLLGGSPGQAWARTAVLAVAEARIAQENAAGALVDARREEMRRLSERLAAIDHRFRVRVEAALSQAMRTARRRALRKAGVRARRVSKTKLASVERDWLAQRLTPSVLAAIATTEDELLDEAFTDAGEQVQSLYAERQTAKRKVLARTFADQGLTEEDLERDWEPVENQRSEGLLAFLLAALMVEARARLQSGTSGPGLFDPRGEVPFDLDVPVPVVRTALLIADGATLDAAGSVVTPSPLEAANPLWNQSDDLVDQVVGAFGPPVEDAGTPGGVVTTYLWEVGDPARPFEPHQQFGGLEFSAEEYPSICAKDPGEFPYGLSVWAPGDHAGCFPAGTIVEGPLPSAATLRWYEGEMVELSFTSGEFLTATPNHPVLTDRGWVAAGLLDEGDDVVRSRGGDGVAGLVPHDRQAPTLIEEVGPSLAKMHGTLARAVPVASKHFHGDGRGSEVTVVRTNRLLSDRLDAALGQPPSEQPLAFGDAKSAFLAGAGGAGAGFDRVGASAFGGVSGADQGVSLRAGQTVHAENLSVALSAQGFDASGAESRGNCAATGALIACERQERFSRPVAGSQFFIDDRELFTARMLGFSGASDGDPVICEELSESAITDSDLVGQLVEGNLVDCVSLDQVVAVRRVPGWAGHVFNLQTSVGWYIANGVLVHNCQCSLTILYGGVAGGEVPVEEEGVFASARVGSIDEEDIERDEAGRFAPKGGGGSDGGGEAASEPEALPKGVTEEMAKEAEAAGVSVLEFKEALDEIPIIRAEMRAEAAARLESVTAMLESVGCGMGEMPRPPSDWKSKGEWDWYRDITGATRSGIERFMAPVGSEGAKEGWDQKHQDAGWNNPQIEGMNLTEFGEWFVGRTNEFYAYANLAQGKSTGRGDPNSLLEDTARPGLDLSKMFGKETTHLTEAALSIVESRRQESDARRDEDERVAGSMLGSARDAAGSGSAPWQMSFQSWEQEVRDLEYRSSTDDWTAGDAARWGELIPRDLDQPSLSIEEQYADIIETARVAGEEVADHARVPW